MERDELIARLRAHREELEARGVEHLAIFGSRARGDSRDDSDLDLLVETTPGGRFSLIDVVAIERRLSEEFGFDVSATMRRSLKPDFARRISDDVLDVF